MKTVILSIHYNQSAVSRYFMAVAQELVKRGYRVVVLVTNQKFHLVNVNSNPIILTWPSKRPVYWRDAIFLHKVIRKYRPHCVIGNFASDTICVLVGWLNCVPHRWSWYHTISRAIDMDAKLSGLRISTLRFRKKIVYYFNTLVIAVSQAAAKDARKTFGLSEKKTSLFLHCLIEPPEIPSQIKQGCLILCVGRLLRFKGQETLLNAAKIVLRTHPGVRFEFVGDGDDRAYFEELSKYLGVQSSCLFTGNISREEVLRKMSTASILVHPSFADAFPLVSLEALSMGLPVVASDVDGIKEQIVDGRTGFLVPPGNSYVLAQKILEILNDNELQKDMQVFARQHFLQNFSLDVLPRQVDEIEKHLAG